jgi:hypothetical protein
LNGPEREDWIAQPADPAIEAILQTDGNFVLYGHAYADGSANPVWASNTARSEPSRIPCSGCI